MIGLSAGIKGQYHIQVIDGITGKVNQEESFINKIPDAYLNGSWAKSRNIRNYFVSLIHRGYMQTPGKCFLSSLVTPNFDIDPNIGSIKGNSLTGAITGISNKNPLLSSDFSNYVGNIGTKTGPVSFTLEKEIVNRQEVPRVDIKREFVFEPKREMSIKSLFITDDFYSVVMSYTNIKRGDTPITINITETDIIKVSFQLSVYDTTPRSYRFTKRIKGVDTLITVSKISTAPALDNRFNLNLLSMSAPILKAVDSTSIGLHSYVDRTLNNGIGLTETFIIDLNAIVPENEYNRMEFVFLGYNYRVDFSPPIVKVPNEELSITLSHTWTVNTSA